MKKALLLSSALTLGAMTPAVAGGLPETVMEEVTVTENTSSSGGMVVPLLLLLVVLAAASGGSGGGGGAAASDIRLKEDITRVGTNHLGLPVYTYRYKGLPGLYEGVMAQDVEIMHPSAIRPLPFGFKAVDYAQLGLTRRQLH